MSADSVNGRTNRAGGGERGARRIEEEQPRPVALALEVGVDAVEVSGGHRPDAIRLRLHVAGSLDISSLLVIVHDTEEERVMPGLPELEGRAAVVTGAASGIGLAVTEAFVAAGMRVLMTDLDQARLASHAERLADGGAEVRALVVDVTDPDAVERAADAAVEHFGKLHVAVNNAGIVVQGNSWELPLSEWHRVIDVDLWGVIHGIRAFVPRILASGEPGYVVNTASMAAVTAIPGIGPYTASKHGVLGISDGLRVELAAIGAPVGVSVVMPGMIKTGLNPLGTVGPEQVAANVVDAIRRGRAYVFTDDHHIPEVESRLRAIIAARADVIS